MKFVRLLSVLAPVGALIGLGVAAVAHAGAKVSRPVTVDLAGRHALGSFGAARNGADGVSRIFCTVGGSKGTGSIEMSCTAMDAAGRKGTCLTSNPVVVQAAAAVHSDSYVEFYWDAAGECTWFYTTTDSADAPKQP
ncbi:hypothetical protein [Pendulispora albinea]|uniref:Secreted protein n=1 Tax=Pendulispora albinea TaxID=2741071 RepID=A0ABZ2MC87_9BACT